VSLRTPVASSMRRRDHPSFPSEITCCFFSVLKTLLMPSEPIRALSGVNVPGFPMAGFQLTLSGGLWATPEDLPFNCPRIGIRTAVKEHHQVTHRAEPEDRKSTRLNSSHSQIWYAVFCLKRKKKTEPAIRAHTPTDSAEDLVDDQDANSKARRAISVTVPIEHQKQELASLLVASSLPLPV